MTVDPSPCFDRNVHVHPQKSYYPVSIPVDHNQLRQLVCCPSDKHLYYVDNQHVYCLDTSTRKRTLIVQLPFKASCTAAAHGWFCAGGHGPDGHFAAVKLPDPPQSSGNVLDGPSDLSDPSDALPYRMRHERLGKYITNSVSIQRLRGSHSGLDDEIVAVLTNNDQAVRIYSLTRSHNFTVDAYDFPMNHASISPDGRLMLLVGDRQEAHLYERRAEGHASAASANDWLFLRKLTLYKPPTAKVSCYFTTAWSSNGRLCATASEHGFVTVFDTQSLHDLDVDPIVAIAPSSRPNSTPGAIRAMCFAPAPWDLLLWTENRGRMCVADLRSGLGSRQVIDLDPTGPDVTEVETVESSGALLESQGVYDFASEIDLMRRHQRELAEPSNGAAGVSFTEHHVPVERRHLSHDTSGPDLHPLTEQEQQMIHGLRTTRRRQFEESPQATSQRNSNIHVEVTGSSESNEIPRSISYTPGLRRQLRSDYSSSPAPENAEARHEIAVLHSIRQYMRHPHIPDVVPSLDRATHAHQPRRQTSVVIAPSQSASGSAPRTPPPHTHAESWILNIPSAPSLTHGSSNPPSRSNHASQTLDSDSIPDLLPVHSSSSSIGASSRSGPLHTMRDRSSFIDAAERRRAQELGGSGSRNEGLTTRGEAMLARQRERERAAAERQGDGDRERENTVRPRATVLNSYEANLLRQMHPGLRHAPLHHRLNPRTDTAPADGIDDSPYPFETWGVGTAGICWGDGGRVVYVATENGIFELKMDFEDRKYWAAITPR